jgi:hypothetical protein
VNEEACDEEKPHEEHMWEWYSGDHGLGVVTLNCLGVDA